MERETKPFDLALYVEDVFIVLLTRHLSKAGSNKAGAIPM